MSNYKTFFQQILKEMKLTTFPTQNVVVNFTLFVIGFTAVMAIYLGALDLGFGKVTIAFLEGLKTSDFAAQFKDVSNVIEMATSTATSTDISTSTATVTDILLK